MTDHYYGHILSSTPTSVTRAVVGTDTVTIETFTAPQKVTLSWEALGRLDAYITKETLQACDADDAPLDDSREVKRLTLEPTDPELQRALGTFPDPHMEHRNTGECLQYMGTEVFPGGEALHTFRHWRDPSTGKLRYWHVPADMDWVRHGLRKGEQRHADCATCGTRKEQA